MDETYLIEKGNHFSNFTWNKLWPFSLSRQIKGTVEFLGDFNYESNGDTNKLIGLSDGWNHHKNSVRIGWRWNDGIQCMIIHYHHGIREIIEGAYFKPNVEYSFNISLGKYKSSIMIEKEVFWLERCPSWRMAFKLWPYFGGKNKAPKDFKFKINIK